MKTDNKKQIADNKKYPKVVVGVFIVNDKGELFLMKTRQWKNRYTCPGGKVEIGDSLVKAAIREVKEETNLDIYDVKFLSLIDGLDIGKEYTLDEGHFIFIDYTARVKDYKKVKLNQEGLGYKWLRPADWLKKNESKFPHKYLIEELKKLEKGIPQDCEYKYRRALADYDNLLKRTAKEKSEFVKFANEQLLLEVLPIYDNLKISLKHIGKDAQTNGWVEGITYVIKQFQDILKNSGVDEIITIGKKFDPCFMEAVEDPSVSSGQDKGEEVKQEIKPGYTLNGKVIIPAKVIIK